MTRAVPELRINDRDLALRLGCIPAETIKHNKELRDRGATLVRDLKTPWMPMFWRRIQADGNRI